MNVIQARESTVKGLRKILDFVEEKDKEGKFDFGDYVSKWDSENGCGTVCCMEGWLPAIYPDNFQWNDCGGMVNCEGITVNGKSHYLPCEELEKVGIYISRDIWWSLTIPHASINLKLDSPFRNVKAYWEKVIKDIEEGKLDDELIGYDENNKTNG